MTIASTAGLLELLRQHQLLEPEQWAALERLPCQLTEPRALAGELIQRGWLTPYQINQIFHDRASSLVLGSYLLLERLGEGGMGTVFKARHRKMGRVVALKALRPERLNNPDAVRRFRREIEAAARLSHPNIVLAFDAGDAGDVHFFTMEYIEGRDLARLIREDGPLEVARACDYVRQAAEGLQHAHEQGMVHRDIKPHNLLLNNKGVIKILDMGLARLERAAAEATTSGSLTHEGTVMGTPDFMAPEQSLSTRTVDIRADLYGLGCTLYFLLAGKVPFPGGTLGDKIARHLAEEPRPLEHLRSETPAAVIAVVRKLMAKKPEDRYDTPAQVAAALSRALHKGSSLGTAMANEETDVDLSFSLHPSAATTQPPALRRRWLWALALSLLLVSAGVVTLLVFARKPSPQRDTTADNHPLAAKKPQPRKILEGHTAAVLVVAFAPRGDKLASADKSGVVRIWQTEKDNALIVQKRHPKAVLALAFAPDGTLASASEGGRIAIWDANTFAEKRLIAPPNIRAVRGLSFPPQADNECLAAVCSEDADKIIALWDVTDGSRIAGRYLPKEVEHYALAFAPDRNYWWAIGLSDGRTLLWNHEVKDQRELKSHTAAVRSVAFTPDGKVLATGGEDGAVKLWDMPAGAARAILGENLGAIHSVAIAADGRLLAAVGADSVVYLWDLGSNACKTRLRLDVGELHGVAFSSNSKLLATCGNDRKVRLWSVADLLKSAPR